MKYVAIIIIVTILTLFFLLDWVNGQTRGGILVVDDFSIVQHSEEDKGRYPIKCEPGREYTVQIVWTYPISNVGTVPEDVLTTQTRIAEEVNWLFVRDGNSYIEAKIPAWKVTEDCKLDILYVPTEFQLHPREKTKYIIIEAKKDYCGKAIIYDDDRPGPENYNTLGSLAWVSHGCMNYYVYTHELVHALGGVQLSAPNSDSGFHVNDFGDVMASPIHIACEGHDNIDCNHNDYFSGRAFQESYLDIHWNIWNSPYLTSAPKYTVVLPVTFREGNYD